MSSELSVKAGDKGEIVTEQAARWTREQVELFKRTILGKDFTDDEMGLAAAICEKTHLDPFTRQIYFTKRGGKMVAQTGIDGYRSLAEESGCYAGGDDYLYDEGISEYAMRKAGRDKPSIAIATVYRMVDGHRVPCTASAAWDEYYPGDAVGAMWRKMPFNQLGKCAEAKALRKAFPRKLSSVYTTDEMAQADNPAPVRAAGPPPDWKPPAKQEKVPLSAFIMPEPPKEAVKPTEIIPPKQEAPALKSGSILVQVGGVRVGWQGQKTSKDGKPYTATRYDVDVMNDDEASPRKVETWDEEVADKARSCVGKLAAVTIETKVNGKFTNYILRSLDPV